jgi:hypothetical protein
VRGQGGEGSMGSLTCNDGLMSSPMLKRVAMQFCYRGRGANPDIWNPISPLLAPICLVFGTLSRA